MKRVTLLSLFLLLFCQSSFAKPYHGFQISNKYNDSFKSYLKKKDVNKYNNIFLLKSIDKIIPSKNNLIVESYVNWYSKPELINPNTCLVKSFYYYKTSFSTWRLEPNGNNRYLSVINSHQKCPMINLNKIGFGGVLSPSNYTQAPKNINTKNISRLVNSKAEIQKQAKWPTQFNNFSFQKSRKPELKNLESVSYNKGKNEYYLQYSCKGGCSCLGNLVFTVKWTNNKFYKVVEVKNQYNAC